MNPLVHVHIALELFKNNKLTPDERDHLIVGSILPDINLSGLIHYYKTHSQTLDFLYFTTNRLHKFLAIGMLLHGEEPKGVDYYAHQENGFIEKNKILIAEIAKKQKKLLGKMNNSTLHQLIEFSTDSITAKLNPQVVPAILKAFKNPKLDPAICSFSNYFELNERKNAKIIRLLKNKHVLNFFHNFSTPKTVPKNWINFTFYLNLKREKHLNFREKLKKLTQMSYFNLKRKMHEKEVASMFEEIDLALKPSALKFLHDTIQSLKPLKNKLKRDLN
jgi:hypothetical protein